MSTKSRERRATGGLWGFMPWYQNTGHGANVKELSSEGGEYSMEEQ